MQPAQADTVKTRLIYLDGLRGFAALMVIVYHLWLSAAAPSWVVRFAPFGSRVSVDLLSPIGALGGSRVSLFFVLSGFVLYWPFACRNKDNRTQDRKNSECFALWLWRRIRRLTPPYYASIVLALLPFVGSFYLLEGWRVWVHHLPPRTPNFGTLFDSFPSCLFFLHGLFPGQETPSFNGALWTLTSEVQLYLTFPLLVALAQCDLRLGKRRVRGLLLAVSTAVLASVIYRAWLYDQIGYFAWSTGDGMLSSAYHCLSNTFLGRWAEFALGMLAADQVARQRLWSPCLLLPFFGASLVWFLVLRSDVAVGGWIGHLFLAAEPSPSPLADAVGGASFALLILCCATTRRLARVFSWRPLVWMGTIAYSLYLVHMPVASCLHRLLEKVSQMEGASAGTRDAGWFLMNLCLGLPLILLIACAFWRVCEQPFSVRSGKPIVSNAVQ